MLNKELILKDVLIHSFQPYALYVKEGSSELNSFNNSNEFSNFRLASVTKQFIAMGIIKLVEANLLTFDTTISNIFKDLPDYFESITILHLLNHTSGILDYEDYLEKDFKDRQLKDSDVYCFLKTTTITYFTPGTKYRYSNTGFILLGLIIEKVSGMSLSDYLSEKVFSLCDMQNTMMNLEGETLIPNRVMGHIIKDGQLIEKDQYWCSATLGDGGIYSNISDLKKWLSYLTAHEQAYLSTMFKDTTLPDGSTTAYGMGMGIKKINNLTIYSHTGSTIGFNTLVLIIPSLDIQVIFLTNLGPTDTDIIRNNIYRYLQK